MNPDERRDGRIEGLMGVAVSVERTVSNGGTFKTDRRSGVALHDLMSDACERSPQVILVQDGLFAAAVQLGYLPGLSGPG
jgi:hypothetical protein